MGNDCKSYVSMNLDRIRLEVSIQHVAVVEVQATSNEALTGLGAIRGEEDSFEKYLRAMCYQAMACGK